MFNLIITIIAIILVAAVTGASVYYGGKAFNKSGADADAAALINGSQQVAAAYTLATAQSSELNNSNFTNYLASVPSVKGTPIITNTADSGTGGTAVAGVVGTNVNTDGYLLVKTTADICQAVVNKTVPVATGANEAVIPTALSGLYNCANGTVTGSANAPVIPSTATGSYYFGYKVK